MRSKSKSPAPPVEPNPARAVFAKKKGGHGRFVRAAKNRFSLRPPIHPASYGLVQTSSPVGCTTVNVLVCKVATWRIGVVMKFPQMPVRNGARRSCAASIFSLSMADSKLRRSRIEKSRVASHSRIRPRDVEYCATSTRSTKTPSERL